MTLKRLLAALLLIPFLRPVLAQDTAQCAATDPADFEQVYACMSSYRRWNGQNIFAGIMSHAGCQTLIRYYRKALETSGISRQDAAAMEVPTCALLARVVREISGKPAYWAECTGYGERPPEEHLAQCLETFIPGYTGTPLARALPRKGCGDLQKDYQRALRTATPTGKPPAGYVQPDCTVVASALATLEAAAGPAPPALPIPGLTAQPADWGPCQGYDPANMPAHLRQCLGEGQELLRLHDCQAVQAAYQAKIIQANGRLPANWLIPPCSVAEPFLAEVKAHWEQKLAAEKAAQDRARAAERLRQFRAAQASLPERPFGSPGPWLTWLLGALLLATVGWRGWRAWRRRAEREAT